MIVGLHRIDANTVKTGIHCFNIPENSNKKKKTPNTTAFRIPFVFLLCLSTSSLMALRQQNVVFNSARVSIEIPSG